METEIKFDEAEAEAIGISEGSETDLTQEEDSEAEIVETEGSNDRLEALKKHESIAEEYKEFSELFPGVSIGSLPDSVNESVRSGVPLSAAYALYHYKKEVAEAAASAINEKNRKRSFAVKKNDLSDSYFSPSEVKEMSPAEVKANYSKIIDSMSHWQ